MLRFFDRLNLTPAERRLVMIIFAVVFVVVNYWVVWPRFGDFAALSEEIESRECQNYFANAGYASVKT